MAVYKVEEVYVISSHEVWLPGCYESERAAKYAFRFSYEDLYNLQESVNPNGIITYQMLVDFRKRGDAN